MKGLCIVFFVFVTLLCASSVYGSGFLNPDIGAASLGMGVSVVAKADDLTAIYFNPAGLTQLKGTHFLVSPRYVSISSDYTNPSTGKTVESSEPSWVGFTGF